MQKSPSGAILGGFSLYPWEMGGAPEQSCAARIRTEIARVMSPASYRYQHRADPV